MKRYNMLTIMEHLWDNDFTEAWWKMYELALAHVASTARGARKGRIMNAIPSLVERCGILERLYVDALPDGSYMAYYIAGQDSNREYGILRDIFDPKTR